MTPLELLRNRLQQPDDTTAEPGMLPAMAEQAPVAAPTITEEEPTGEPVLRLRDRLQQEVQQSQMFLANSLRDNRFSPEKAAEAVDLSRRTNTPLVVFEDPAALERASVDAQVRATIDKVSGAPLTGALFGQDKWLARSMADSIGSVADIETAFKESGFAVAARQQKLLEDRDAWEEYREKERAAKEAGARQASFSDMTFRGAFDALASGLPAGLSSVVGGYQETTRIVRETLPFDIPAQDPLAEVFGVDSERLLQNVESSLASQAEELRGAEESYAYDVAAGVGQLVPQIAAYLVSAPVGLSTMFFQGVDTMADKIEDDTDASPTARNTALVVGGLVTAISSKVSMDAILGKYIPKIANELAAALTRIGVAGAAEGAQEITENLLMDATRILLTNREAGFEVVDAAYEGAVGAGVGGVVRAIAEAAIGVKRRGMRAQAEKDREDIQRMLDLVSETQAATRAPESFGQVLSEVTEGATVFVDPVALDSALRNIGADYSKLPSTTDAARAQAAQGVGSGLEVKLSELATTFAGSGVEAEVLDNLRRTPDAMSAAEARAMQATIQEDIAQEVDKIISRVSEDTAFRESGKRVREDFRTALEAAGEAKAVADANARLVEAFTSTMARYWGVTPEQLYNGWTDANGVARPGIKARVLGPKGETAPEAPAFTPATPETFTAAALPNLLQTGDWAILTAENPRGVEISPEENTARNAQLKADLDAMGVSYIEGAVGRYNTIENPFVITGITRAQAQALARKYDQDSVLTRDGLIYGDGTVERATGVTMHATDPGDYFTTMPDGTMFTVDIDFESGRQPLDEDNGLVPPAAEAPRPPRGEALEQRVRLTEEERAVEKEMDDWISSDPEAAVDAYLAAFGNEINTDLSREFSPAYKADRTKWSAAVHEPSSRLAKLAYARLLDTLPAGSTILFSGGGGGSGKGFALRVAGLSAQADGVYDLTMANYESTREKIDAALASGMRVRVAFVRAPVETAAAREISRAKDEGRIVRAEAFAAAHSAAPFTFNMLQQDFAGDNRVEILLVDNVDTPTVVEPATLEVPDYASVDRSFRDEIARQVEAGTLDDETAAAFLGEAAARGDAAVRGAEPERDATGVRGVRDGRDQEEGALGQSVSTRVWTQQAGRQDPHLTTGLDVDFRLANDRPKFQEKLAGAMKGLTQLRITARKPAAVLEQAVAQMQDNLRWLFEQVPPEVRDRSRKWYDGGRVIVDRWVEKYAGQYTDAQLAGVLAVMSPQLAWDANVTLAERITDIYTEQQDTAWSPEMEKTAERIIGEPTSRAMFDAIRGKKLSELTDNLEAAVWIRVFDETYNPRPFRQITPEGGFGDWMRTVKGAKTNAGWQNGHGPIANAVSILRDGSVPNISRSLGGEHKVRNFYNNIFDPSDDTSVTIDTHAVAAALLSPLSGSSPEVLANFGAPSDSATGMSGTYVAYAEAYRRLAAEVGLLPREVQSITWEAVRRMYTAPFKSQFVKQKDLQKKFAEVWKGYTSGKESIDETRKQLVALTGKDRIPDPAWTGLDSGLDAGAPASSYAGGVLESDWAGRTADTGAGGAAPAGDQAFGQSAGLTSPPVNEDGTVTLWHFGKVPDLGELDPAMSGTGIAGADIRRRDSDPDNWVNRTYYGIALGQPGGYRRETGLGQNLYRVDVPFEKLYDMARDPDGLRPQRSELSGWDNAASVFERRVKEAGYLGFWANNAQLGLAAAVFEKMPVKQVPKNEAPDGAFGQAVRQTETPEFKRWFGDSKVVDENGQPLVVYHGTTEDFASFDSFGRSLGAHFGTRGQAEDRLAFSADQTGARYFFGEYDPGAQIMPVYISVRNPLRLEENEGGDWSPPAVKAMLVEKFPGSEKQLQNLRTLQQLRGFMEAQGFDGIVYENRFEVEGAKQLRDARTDARVAYARAGRVEGSPEHVAYLEADKALSEYLASASKQDSYIVFRPEQIKSAVGNRGAFDPNDPDILAQQRRGQFRPQTLEIERLAAADKTTVTHELGHYFLTSLTNMAVDPDAPAEIRSLAEAFLKQTGFEGTLEQWVQTPLNEQREAHETFAESWEAYIFSGKAPTQELRGLFRRMSEFFKSVYRSIREFIASPAGARVKTDPELTVLFDRLLATEDQIETAARERAYEAFFASAADAGMSPEQFAEYMALDGEHRAQAEESLRALMLRDLKGEAAERRGEVRAEVEAELSQEPVYRAMLWLRRGKFYQDGALVDAPEGLEGKLSLPALKEMFPNVADWKKLGFGKYGMAANDGVHPDVVAPLLGFESGDAMVRALLDAPNLTEAIETETNARMFDQYNDLASPENMARAVDEAVHNDASLERIATEIAALYNRVGQKDRLMAAARQYAKAILETKTSRTLRPSDYAAAELRAGKAALDALRKGDRETALKQKRIEILNHALALEAHKASRGMDKMVERMRSIARKGDDTSSVKSRDGDMVNAVRAILGAYGLGAPRTAEKASAYLARLAEYDPNKAAYLARELDAATENAKDWRQLPLGELRELHGLVKDLWTDARESRSIEVDGEKVLINDAQDQIVDVLSKRPAYNKVRGKNEAMTDKDKREIDLGGLKGRLNRVLQWTGAMDKSRTGPLRRFLWWALADASDNFRAAKKEVGGRYTALLKQYAHLFKDESKIAAGEINYTFTGATELIAALLHTGNDSNLRKLLLGGRKESPWGDLAADGKTLDRSRWDAMVQRLTSEGKITKDHWDFVQGVWNILEDIKPAAQKAHRSLFGRSFNEITANPVQTPFGEYRGGYFPAVTDPNQVGDSLRRAIQEENQSFSYAMPDRGFTKERVEYNRPLLLDMRVVSGHIDKVLTFAYLAKPVSDVRRVLGGAEVTDALERTQPGALKNMLLPYLDRVAHQRVESTDEASGNLFDRIIRSTRRNTSMMFMFANLTNTLLQFTGAPLSAMKVPVGYLLKAQADLVTRPKVSYQFIIESSKFMEDRLTNSNALMYDNMREILINPSVYEKMQNWSARNAYITQLWADRLISTTVWLGAYNHALETAEASLTHEQKQVQARQLADAAVRETQMDQSPEGIAAFEAGTPFQRLFTQFIGYFNMWATTTAEELQVARGERNWARMSFVAFLSLAIVPALGEVIRLAVAGGPEDEDDDGYLDDWLRTIGWGTLKFYSAAVPYAGPVLVGAIGGATQTDDPFAGKVLASPVAGAVERALRTTRYVSKAIEGEDEVKPGQIIKSTAAALTLMTGLPFYAPARGFAYAADVEAGEIDPTSRADYIRGILTGIASPESK